MVWVALVIAGLFEIVWAVGLKYTEGFTRLWPTAGTLLAMGGSFGLLAYAMKTLPVGTAYAIWTGIGAVGTVLMGVTVFGETLAPVQLLLLGLLIAVLIGLKLATPKAAGPS